jgi:hypothetical protein
MKEDHQAIKTITITAVETEETGSKWIQTETHHHRCKIDLLLTWVDQADQEGKAVQEDQEECHQEVNHRIDHLEICLLVECHLKTDHPQETCLQIRII